MTGILKDVMHERADSLDPPDLDVSAMLHEGDRLVRQRRLGLAGLAAAVVLVAAVVTVPAMLAQDSRDTEVTTPVVSYDLAYGLGTTIHDGARTVETDVSISALVQAPSGYVVADAEGRVHTVVDGESTEVGRLADTDVGRLASDDDVVAWVDAADAGTLSVLDLATGDRVDVPVAELPGEPVSRDAAGQAGGVGADVAAVDGRTVYVSDARGVLAWKALDGDDPVLLPAPDGVEVQVLDVQDGQVLQVARSFEPQEVDGSTTMVQVEELRLGRDLLDTRALPGTGGQLSPDGRRAVLTERVSPPADLSYYTTVVGDVAGDAWVSVAPRRYTSVLGFQWLDADTFVASAGIYRDRSARQDLVSCEASTAECTVAVRDEPDGLVVATGRMHR